MIVHNFENSLISVGCLPSPPFHHTKTLAFRTYFTSFMHNHYIQTNKNLLARCHYVQELSRLEQVISTIPSWDQISQEKNYVLKNFLTSRIRFNFLDLFVKLFTS